jgi:hypothetical protein
MASKLHICWQRPRGANRKEDNNMAKKTIKRLKKSTKVEAAKTLRKLGIG